jgi:hypothetical protein
MSGASISLAAKRVGDLNKLTVDARVFVGSVGVGYVMEAVLGADGPRPGAVKLQACAD